MERSILIIIILDAAVTIFFFWKTVKGYFFMKDVIGWEESEAIIHDLVQVTKRGKSFEDVVVQFKTPDKRNIQAKTGRIKRNTLTAGEKIHILYNPDDPYEAITKGDENIRFKAGITGMAALIIFNIAAGLIYYFTVYLNY